MKVFAFVAILALTFSAANAENYKVLFVSTYPFAFGSESGETGFTPTVNWFTNSNTWTAWQLNPSQVASSELLDFTTDAADANPEGAADTFEAYVGGQSGGATAQGDAMYKSPSSVQNTININNRYGSFAVRIGGSPDFYLGAQNVDLYDGGAGFADYIDVPLYALDSNLYETETMTPPFEEYTPQSQSASASTNTLFAPQPVKAATAAMFSDSGDPIQVGSLHYYKESAPPVVTSITPEQVNNDGSSTITVAGYNFGPELLNVPTRSVTVNGEDCPVPEIDGVQDAGSFYIVCQAPAMDNGVYDVVVNIDGGQDSTGGEGMATYVKPPKQELSGSAFVVPTLLAMLVAVFAL